LSSPDPIEAVHSDPGVIANAVGHSPPKPRFNRIAGSVRMLIAPTKLQ
jgi:hypothetical protein